MVAVVALGLALIFLPCILLGGFLFDDPAHQAAAIFAVAAIMASEASAWCGFVCAIEAFQNTSARSVIYGIRYLVLPVCTLAAILYFMTR
ncbi:MAG: hypothetical protein ACTHM8_00820 [Sphingomonas sp.]